MKYLALLALSLTLVGCASSDASKSQPLVIEIQNGNLEARGWTMSVDDLPELVKAWHPRSVIIKGSGDGDLRPDFSIATKAKNTLQAAGVADVTIDKANE